ncbi:hypothetical protein SMD20_36630 [Nonomuraea sp. LP-02]|uniref:hypothetical protein n=1 Tax=Nonomuraea sp. LP-02 TaxID=3097960 RepID=UPI002E2F8C52|nr:hypothetical protein [Nonomuraea sp. LP-02]MED7929814.1 hypothetical protein [Nonomuraea sp. LP-02]
MPVEPSLAPGVEEGAKKSGVLWLGLAGGSRLAWHVWHDGAIYLVTGGEEQSLPGLDALDRVRVTLRSKDNGARLVEFDAAVSVVDQERASEAVAALAKERLNARDAEHLTERWARECVVVRLTPVS